jgi:37-kD nucleoid-associated bacterial protein
MNVIKYLFEQSTHYSIKAGEVFLLQLNGIQFNNQIVRGFGIFKIEHPTKFIKSHFDNKNYQLYYDDGILSKNVEKGCVVLDLDYENGYTVLSYEKNSSDTNYWYKDFLNLKRKANEFNNTNLLMESLKGFVSDDESNDMLTKKDKIAIVKSGMESLMEQEDTIELNSFIAKVLPDQQQQDQYLQYLNEFQSAMDYDLESTLTVSNDAIKYQQKRNKSILKLDKNFHVYIHGDMKQIEQGVDADGRKFYKLYYQVEE